MDGVEVDMLAALAPFPLTDLQEAYLVGATQLFELGGIRPTYYVELEMVGLDIPRAERAINRLIAAHDHLRTVILAGGGQCVRDADLLPSFTLPVIDLVGLDPDRQETALRQTRQRLSEHGVDPAGWPLFEVVVSRVRPHRVRVHLAMSLLLLDGRSIRQVRDEWQALYRDDETVLATAPMTFRECRLAQAAHESTDEYRAHLRYWQARLDSLPEAPRLPLARRPETPDPIRFTRRSCHLTPVRWQQLCATARRHRLMPATALLHLFAEAIGAWAASPHFCLNVLHQGWLTNHPEWAAVVGQFGATLPLEIRGGGDFWDRARQTQSQLWRDLAHCDVSAVRIAREASTRRGRAPHASLPYVFTSMLGQAPGRAPAALRPGCREVYSSLRTPQVLIDNQIVDAEDGGVDCVWDVVDDAFPSGLPEIMFAAYRSMVETVADPDRPNRVPDPVPAGHRARVAVINATAAPVPRGRLEDGFLRQAATRPDAVALVTARRTMTYRELDAASRAVAGWLRGRGVGRSDVVPVVMAKGWEQVVAVLGILRAGAAYCPVDAGLPSERIRTVLGECSAGIVLAQSHQAPDLGGHDANAVLHVDRVDPATVRCSTEDAGPGGTPADLAYVIYTSGSTGRPKGVMIEHRAALNTVLEVNRRIGLRADDRVFGISSLSFDLSVWDVFGALAGGAALVLADATVRPDPLGWAAAAARHGVTVWNSVPALAEMLLEAVGQRPELGRPPIRVFLLSGDWIPVGLPDRMRARWRRARIVAMGGATEASIWSNGYEVDRVEPGWRSIPYGMPLRNQTMRVLDDRLDVRPPWAEGGIYIGGVGLARGYWRDEERTTERFVRHPRTGERLYWTGDLGRYWPDGAIELLGRADRQVKVQGFRVEPGEVEAAMLSHPAIRACVVGVDPAPGGQRRLVSLAVPEADLPADPSAIAAHLRARLPYYMVPTQIHLVAELPLTASGKVDVGRALAMLPAPVTPTTIDPDGQSDGQSDGRLMGRLAELWADLMGLAEVGPDDDFFALGGTSLLALRLVNRLRAELGVDLPLGQMFEAPSVRGLARRIEQGVGGGACGVELAGGDGIGLFLFHPVGGSVAGYRELAHAWPGPVRAFQSRRLVDAGAGSDPDLETMAAGYRENLQRFKPAGPYVLGGWSMGGVLAFEVGRQLTGMGHECRVFMIDSEVPGTGSPTGPAGRHLDFLRELGHGHLPAEVPAASWVEAAELARVARDTAVDHGLLPATTDVGTYARLVSAFAHNAEVLATYRPARSWAPTLLFVAAAYDDRPDPVPPWRALCPGIEVEVLPEDHYSIMSGDRLAAIAARVTAWLSRLNVVPL